jgi:hypothetical protein
LANWVQSYFDTDDDSIIPLGSDIPNVTAAYAKAFDDNGRRRPSGPVRHVIYTTR